MPVDLVISAASDLYLFAQSDQTYQSLFHSNRKLSSEHS